MSAPLPARQSIARNASSADPILAEPSAELLAESSVEISAQLRAGAQNRWAIAPASIDHESRVTAEDHSALKLWLRLLTCTNLVERQIRQSLRHEFASTLPRFDLLAQLERHPQGLKMRELSHRLMVTSGNITGLANQLEHEGLIERVSASEDRRSTFLRLTASGRERFAQMAQTHERWVIELCAGLNRQEMQALHTLLGKLKRGIAEPTQAQAAAAG